MTRLRSLIKEATLKGPLVGSHAKNIAALKSFLTRANKLARELDILESEMSGPSQTYNVWLMTKEQEDALETIRELVGGAADVLNKGLSKVKLVKEGVIKEAPWAETQKMSPADSHMYQIAKSTLKMPGPIAGVMGRCCDDRWPPAEKEKAKEIIKRIEAKYGIKSEVGVVSKRNK